MSDMNQYIKKSHIRAVEKFNEELRRWAEYTEGDADGEAQLYEDANTDFTLSNVRIQVRTKGFTNQSCERISLSPGW